MKYDYLFRNEESRKFNSFVSEYENGDSRKLIEDFIYEADHHVSSYIDGRFYVEDPVGPVRSSFRFDKYVSGGCGELLTYMAYAQIQIIKDVSTGNLDCIKFDFKDGNCIYTIDFIKMLKHTLNNKFSPVSKRQRNLTKFESEYSEEIKEIIEDIIKRVLSHKYLNGPEGLIANSPNTIEVTIYNNANLKELPHNLNVEEVLKSKICDELNVYFGIMEDKIKLDIKESSITVRFENINALLLVFSKYINTNYIESNKL